LVKPLFYFALYIAVEVQYTMLIPRSMRVFFNLLYHPFAFAYDIVAVVVSLNRWKDWVTTILPFIEGGRVLELGHGPGHLQRALQGQGLAAVGLDESAPMGHLAKTHLLKSGFKDIHLARGISQNLPFADNTFNTIVSTFPSEYIFDPRTLSEARRCLINGGRLVVLPVAWPKNRFLNWLYRITGEASPNAMEIISERIGAPLAKAGFEVEIKTLEVKSSLLVIVIAVKSLPLL
jgi:ubiquinone/menaquinone biosynthesis C-methylase UbiE